MSTATPSLTPSSSPVTPQEARWNPWPAGLGVFFALLISTITGFIVFAVRQDMDLVRPDYYEQELRHSHQMERVRRTRESAAEASITTTAEGIRVSLPSAHSGERFSGTLRLYRPSDASLDRVIPLSPDVHGLQTVPVDDLRPGLWRAQANWTFDDMEFYLESAVILESGRGAR